MLCSMRNDKDLKEELRQRKVAEYRQWLQLPYNQQDYDEMEKIITLLLDIKGNKKLELTGNAEDDARNRIMFALSWAN